MNKRYGWSKFIIMVRPSLSVKASTSRFRSRPTILRKAMARRRGFSSTIPSSSTSWRAFRPTPASMSWSSTSRRLPRRAQTIAGSTMSWMTFSHAVPSMSRVEPSHPDPRRAAKDGRQGHDGGLAKIQAARDPALSATHKTQHNRIHRLDALDAYNQKLVKK